MWAFVRTGPVIAALALLALAPAAWAGGHVVVTDAWSRATPAGAPTAVGYLTIANRGATPDRLMSVDSPAAATVSVHQMSMAGGIMRMRPVIGGLEVAPGGSVSLDPNGDHLMFEGLKRPFKAGEQVPVVLRFQHAGAVRIVFVVR
jgi:periplasmic copper chaperone A